MRRDIEFKSKGTMCRGWFYTPDEGRGPLLEIAAEVATVWLSDHLVEPYESVGQA